MNEKMIDGVLHVADDRALGGWRKLTDRELSLMLQEARRAQHIATPYPLVGRPLGGQRIGPLQPSTGDPFPPREPYVWCNGRPMVNPVD